MSRTPARRPRNRQVTTTDLGKVAPAPNLVTRDDLHYGRRDAILASRKQMRIRTTAATRQHYRQTQATVQDLGAETTKLSLS